MGDSRKESVHGIPQFSGTGYDNWSLRVKRYLKSLKLFDVIKNDPPGAAADIPKFQQQDGKAANLLISFIHDDLLDFVREKDTSKEILRSLEAVCASHLRLC